MIIICFSSKSPTCHHGVGKQNCLQKMGLTLVNSTYRNVILESLSHEAEIVCLSHIWVPCLSPKKRPQSYYYITEPPITAAEYNGVQVQVTETTPVIVVPLKTIIAPQFLRNLKSSPNTILFSSRIVGCV